MGELIWLQVVVTVVALGLPIISYRPRSPLSLLLDAVALVVHNTWVVVRDDRLQGKDVDPTLLVVADEYLVLRRKVFAEETHSLNIKKRNELYTRAHRNVDQSNATDSSFFSDLIVFIVVGSIALGALVGLPLAVFFLVREDPQILGIMLLFGVAIFLGVKILGKLSPPRYQYAPVVGSKMPWKDLQPLSISDCNSDRDAIAWLTAAHEGDGQAGGSPRSPDPDLESRMGAAVPVQPGIAEIALGYNQEAISQIRSYLRKTRTTNLAMSIASFIGFLVAVGFVLYSSVYLGKGSFSAIFGGVGLGAVLAGFCYKVSSQTRIAQIALALFESYVAELRLNLNEAEAEGEAIEKRELRSRAWQEFRIGLNGLWALESKAGASIQPGSSSATKPEG